MNQGDLSESAPTSEARPPEEGKKGGGKGGKGAKKEKAGREYLGWEAANDIEWRVHMEYTGRKNWESKYGPCSEWWNRYEEWICSGMNRAMRKPSFRGLEWLKYQRGIEVAPVGECHTRKRYGIKDYFVEPVENYCCRPCPYPKTTTGEVGWLGQHKCCQLEIYPNDFMKKPPLPWHHTKISSFLPGSM